MRQAIYVVGILLVWTLGAEAEAAWFSENFEDIRGLKLGG